MALSATLSKMSKAEVMRTKAVRKMKEMEAAIRQAEIEEELEHQWEEEEASKRQYDEELQAAKEMEKKRKAAMAAREAVGKKTGESTKGKGKSKRIVKTDEESDVSKLPPKKKVKAEGSGAPQIEAVVPCIW